MGRRTDHSREELREVILSAAEMIVTQTGENGLSARAIAKRIGYSVGTLYNLFDDLDDLIVHVNARTLDALYKACARPGGQDSPGETLRAYARAYLRFTERHANRWALLLGRNSPRAGDLPEWYQSKVQRLLLLVENALAPCFDDRQHDRRQRAALVLWTSLEGIASLAHAKAIGADPLQLADELIVTFLRGLEPRQAQGIVSTPAAP